MPISFMDKLIISIFMINLYNACFAVTGAIRGTSTEKLTRVKEGTPYQA